MLAQEVLLVKAVAGLAVTEVAVVRPELQTTRLHMIIISGLVVGVVGLAVLILAPQVRQIEYHPTHVLIITNLRVVIAVEARGATL